MNAEFEKRRVGLCFCLWLLLLVVVAGFGAHAGSANVAISASPYTVVVTNEGARVQPTIYLVGQTDPSGETPRHTLGPTLNGTRLCERMLSQAVLILRPNGTGTYGYRAGFELFPEPIASWPEHEVFFGKWKYDPLAPAQITRGAGNHLQLASRQRPVSTVYELCFPESIRIRSVKVEANCEQRTAGFDAITRVWADPRGERLLGEASRKPGSTDRQYPHVVEGLDTSCAYVELTSDGKHNGASAYQVTLSAELDTKRLRLPTLAKGRNELTFTDDADSSHRARLILRWGTAGRRRPSPPIPEAIRKYRSPRSGAPAQEGRIVKLNEFFPLGFYGGVGDYPLPAVEWLMDQMSAIRVNAWYLNNFSTKRLAELVPMAEQRGLRLLPQGSGWGSLFYQVRGGTPAGRREQYARTLVPSASQVVPEWRGRPGLLAWSLAEEVLPGGAQELSPYYELMRKLDPSHEPVVMHNSPSECEADLKRNRNPVVFHDLYPFFIEPRSGPCTTGRSLEYLKRRLGIYSAIARKGGVPMWVLLQAYGAPPEFDPEPPHFGYHGGMRDPTAAHLRVQAWLALAYGAKGLWWYPYRNNDSDGTSPVSPNWTLSPIWDEIRAIHATIAPLADVLLQLDPAPDGRVAEVSGEDLHWAWQRRRGETGGTRHLIVVNENLKEPRTVTLQPLNPAHQVRDLSANPSEARTSLTLPPGGGALLQIGSGS